MGGVPQGTRRKNWRPPYREGIVPTIRDFRPKPYEKGVGEGGSENSFKVLQKELKKEEGMKKLKR